MSVKCSLKRANEPCGVPNGICKGQKCSDCPHPDDRLKRIYDKIDELREK